MQDLLAPGALRGQDGPRRENLEPEEGGYCALQASHPQRGGLGGGGVFGYHGADGLYCRGDRRGWQAGLGAAGGGVDGGARFRCLNRGGAGLVERQVDGFRLIRFRGRAFRFQVGLLHFDLRPADVPAVALLWSKGRSVKQPARRRFQRSDGPGPTPRTALGTVLIRSALSGTDKPASSLQAGALCASRIDAFTCIRFSQPRRAQPLGREQWPLCEGPGGGGIERDAGTGVSWPSSRSAGRGGGRSLREAGRRGGVNIKAGKHPAWRHASLEMQTRRR